MADPQSSSSGVQQQAGTAPEAIWIPFIRDLYPKLLSQSHFLPPIHFNLTPQAVATIAGQIALVRDNPSSSGHLPQPPVPSSAQVAGTLFVKNVPQLQPVRIQDSDKRDDLAQQRCLQALSRLPNQVMIVISSLVFRKYLNKHTSPIHAAAIAQLPTIQDPSIPEQIADGECDIVVIHRSFGLFIREIKSAGSNDFFRSQTPVEQTDVVIRKIGEAVKQLNNQEIALRHLVSDLPPIRITKTLLLPNITSGQLQSALSTSPPLLQMLCQTLSLRVDINLAVLHCLCKEDLAHPSTWWQTLTTAGPDQSMTDDLYERLVARFCGPATVVDIPTAGPPRKVLRSWGEAVAETGLRFSSLTLTPTQVSLLNRDPEPRFMYLAGPPGTGKTIVLLLKALQWAQQGRQVVVVSGDNQSRAVTMLLETQLSSILRPAAAAAAAAASRIQRHCCDFDDRSFQAGAAVSSLQRQIGPASGPVFVIFDEVADSYRSRFIQWLSEAGTRIPALSVWAAGIYRLDRALAVPLPAWLEVQTMQEALRCPPTVTKRLQQSDDIQFNNVPQYSDPQHPVATQGPPVRRLRHKGQPGHSEKNPWQCVACADHVAGIITELRVGQPGQQPLQYRDVWILYVGDVPRLGDMIVQRLQQHHRLPVGVVTSLPLSLVDARELALAVTDRVMLTRWDAVQGLERRVVVVLGTDRHYWALLSQSRCSSALYIIG